MKVSDILSFLQLPVPIGLPLLITNIDAMVISYFFVELSNGFLFYFALGTAIIIINVLTICFGEKDIDVFYNDHIKVFTPVIVTFYLYVFGFSGILYYMYLCISIFFLWLLIVFTEPASLINFLESFPFILYGVPSFRNLIVAVYIIIVIVVSISDKVIQFYKKYNHQIKVALVLITSFTALFYFSDGISKVSIFLYKFIIIGVLFILYVFPAFLAIIVVVLATIVAFFPDAFGIPRETIDFYGKYNNQMKVVLVLVTSFAALFYFSDGISKAFIFLYKFIITGVLFILYVFPAFLAIIVVVLATIVAFFPNAFGIPREIIDFYGKYNNQMKVALVLVTSFAALFYFSDGISKAFIFLYKFIITGVLFILYVFPAFLAIIVVVLATIVAFFPDAFGIPRETIDFYRKYSNQMKVALVLITSSAALFYFYHGLIDELSMIFLFILYLLIAFLHQKYNNKSKVARLIEEIPHKDLDKLGKVDDGTLIAVESIEGQKHGKQESFKVDVQQVPKAKKSSGVMVAASMVDGLKAIEAGLVRKFHYEELKTATTKFSDRLGKGGSGQVFKGILMDGESVAVKRVEREVYGEKEFLSELSATASTQHFNLVRLHGYCSHVSRTRRFYFIVYDLFKNGSLDSWIFHGMNYRNGRFLSWKRRCRVALDIAKALVYLHRDCGKQILHLDIKPENILVGDDFRGVLSDFGMSKLMGKDESRFHTEMTRGTRDYMAPEWNSGHGMEKSVDIFSYGKVLMDMFLGQRCVCFNQKGEDIYVRGGNTPLEQRKALIYVKKKIVKKEILDLIDKRLMGDGGVDERSASLFVNVAIQCLKEDPRKRPRDMWVVFKMLEPILNDPDDKKEDDEDEDDDDEEEND